MKKIVRGFFLISGGCFAFSLFLFSSASADTLFLKNGKDIKGLVVEKYADRVVLSTEKGEIPVLLSGIKKIKYDDLEQNYMQIGRAYEAEKKYGEALAYYEKSLEINPNLEEARVSAVAMRSHFWAKSTEGPKGEMEKQQEIYDKWSRGIPTEQVVKKIIDENTESLRKGIGVVLEKKGDWVRLSQVDAKKDAAKTGMKKGDRLISIDGVSLRYLSAEVIASKMRTPRFSSFELEYERDCFVRRESGAFPPDLGVKIKVEYKGSVIEKVAVHSPAEKAGIRGGDYLIAVAGASTRYMPQSQILKKIKNHQIDPVVFTVRRSAFLTRR